MYKSTKSSSLMTKNSINLMYASFIGGYLVTYILDVILEYTIKDEKMRRSIKSRVFLVISFILMMGAFMLPD